jgi:hypothetical protein
MMMLLRVYQMVSKRRVLARLLISKTFNGAGSWN